MSGGLISPKDISVPLKGSPTDLKEEGYDAEGTGWAFERKRKEIPESSVRKRTSSTRRGWRQERGFERG